MLKNSLINNKKTIDSSEPASERIWAVGMLHLVLLLLVVFVVEVSTVQADGLFDFQMKLAKKGNIEAQFKVGEMYETGFGVKENMKEADIWIKKAAGQGHEAAGFKLLYWDIKKNGMRSDNKAKYNELAKKAEAGNGEAMYYVGKMYAEGVGVKKNYDKALGWLNKATFIGVLEAEREAVAVRERKQRALAQSRRREAKRKAAAAAAATKRQEEVKRKQAEKKAEENRKNEAAAAASTAAAADRKAEQGRLRTERATAERERKRQALLKQRAEQEKKRKEQFESDPCSGKSARFLSTCR